MALDPRTFHDIIKAHVKQAKNDHEEWDRLRDLYQCRNWGGADPGRDEDLVTESGAIYAYVDSMISSVVPPNPQITCNARNSRHTDAAQYRAALVNDTFRRARAHRTLWKLATHAAVYPRGVLKTVWNHSQNRPDFLVVDPRNFFFDLTATRFEDIKYAIEVTVLTEAEFAQRVKGKRTRGNRIYDGNVSKKVKFGSYPSWLKNPDSGRVELSKSLRGVFKWTVIFEIWDFTVPGGKYYHMLEDSKEPLFAGDPPYVFVKNPFHLLTFNDNLEDAGGLADAKLVEDPIRRRDELLTIRLRHAQASIPIPVVNESVLDDPEQAADQIANATGPGDMVRLKLKNDATIADAFGQTPTAALNPAFDAADAMLEQEVNFRLGLPQYTRGVTGTSDIATELALVDAALRTRQGRRSELVNDVVTNMAQATVGLYEEYMSSDSSLPVRLGRNEYLDVARQHLQARNPQMAEEQAQRGIPIEKPLEIDYDVVPYSPVENSKTAQLKKVREFSELLFQNPAIDQKKLLVKVVDLLDLGDDLVLSEEQMQQMQQAQQPPGAETAGQAAAGAESILTGTEQSLNGGGLPMGVEAPVDTGALAGMAGGAGFSTPQA